MTKYKFLRKSGASAGRAAMMKLEPLARCRTGPYDVGMISPAHDRGGEPGFRQPASPPSGGDAGFFCRNRAHYSLTMAKGRILIGKPGLDGHDRGAKYIVQVLQRRGLRSHLHRHPPQPGRNRGHGDPTMMSTRSA